MGILAKFSILRANEPIIRRSISDVVQFFSTRYSTFAEPPYS